MNYPYVKEQSRHQVFPPPKTFRAHIADMKTYEEHCLRAEKNPEAYWAERASTLLSWTKPWDEVLRQHKAGNVDWFSGGKLNACENCVDRHVGAGQGQKTALFWQGEPEKDQCSLTFSQLQEKVCRVAQVLMRSGVQTGDRVALYMPMIPELVVAMLACARIGAAHVVVFAGFSAAGLQKRLEDSKSKVLITADAVLRSGRALPLKDKVDQALTQCPWVRSCLVVKRAGTTIAMQKNRDLWWHEVCADPSLSDFCDCVSVDAGHMLFLLYTSGSTGAPKGIMHGTGGYLTYAAHSTQWVFNIYDDDIHFCTADIGWITGHTYSVYGPLALGVTTVLFEGVPSFPDPARFWAVAEKFQATSFYTAPTAIRALMQEGDAWTQKNDLSSLRVLGSVGEPINPEAWLWYHRNIGKSRLPVVDTWWQTETGGILISALPFATTLKPGSATYALPGIAAAVVNAEGQDRIEEAGHLVITRPWPGMLLGIYKDPERCAEQYFSRFSGCYDSGDGARVDKDGYFWILGRLDDVINVSGHRLGTAEIEAALAAHEAVIEAAVVPMPHAIKGQSIYAYVILRQDIDESSELEKALKNHVRQEIGPLATPEKIQFALALPKTRSGKILRRILRKITEGSTGMEDFGDTSTLSDPSVIPDLIAGRESAADPARRQE